MDYSAFNDDVEIGYKVRYYRKLRNVSQTQLAEWIGVSRGVIMRLEKDNSIPSADIMFAIAKHLEIPPIYIFKESEFTYFLYECVPGKTVIHPEECFRNFGFTRFSCDFSLNPNDYYSILDGNKRYLARKMFTDDCDRVLCVDDSYTCVLCTKTDRGYISDVDNTIIDKDFVIAGIVLDITDVSFSIDRL